MGSRGAALALAVALAACSREALRIELPEESGGALGLILAIDAPDRSKVLAIDPAAPGPLAEHLMLPDYEGEPVELTLLSYRVGLERLSLEPGLLTPVAGSAGVPLGELEPAERTTFKLSVEEGEAGAWVKISTLPPALAALPVAAKPPSRCASVRVVPIQSVRQELLDLDVAVVPTPGAAIFGGNGASGVAIIGRLTRDQDLELRELEPGDQRVTGLGWPGGDTIFGAIRRQRPTEAKLIQLDLEGRTVSSSTLATAEGESFLIAGGGGLAVAYSPSRVLELQRSTAGVIDRTAEFPPNIAHLHIVSPRRMVAITHESELHEFDGDRWSKRTLALPSGDTLRGASGDEEVLVAYSVSTLFQKDERLDIWTRIDAEIGSARYLTAAGLGGGSFFLTGNTGVMRLHEPGRDWCRIDSFSYRWIYTAPTIPEGGAAFCWTDADLPENLTTEMFWVEL